MIIDHIGLTVKNTQISDRFYEKVLKPLGIVKIIEVQGWMGYGHQDNPNKAEFWFGENDDSQKNIPLHIAFAAQSRQMVDEFYKAAINAGATCNGKPGIREIYHPNYYGAFIIDPDGHNIEAVCHTA